MKTIELKRLELTNYRNIEFLSLEFNGSSKIIGENRIGKTNTLEAIYWLLTDKLLDGSSDISAIKPLKDTKLEVSVKGTFDIDGKLVTLEKRYKENWVKTRGTTNIEMKGHVMACLYNGIAQSTLKAYDQLVAEDFGFMQDQTTKIDFMQMLINPFYLGNLGESKDWTELRNFIIKLVGDVSDDDVAKAKPELAIVVSDLNAASGRFDQLKKKYANDIEGLKTTLISDDAQIKLLEETPNPTDDELAIAKKGIEEHQAKIDSLKNQKGVDVATIEISNKISNLRLKISELEKADLEKAVDPREPKLSELRKASNELITERVKLVNERSTIEFKTSSLQEKHKTCREYRSELIEKLKAIDAKIKSPSFETECPTCHRAYEESEIETRKAEAIKVLEEEKASLIEKGKINKDDMTSIESRIEDLLTQYETVDNEIKEIESKFDGFAKEIETLGAAPTTAVAPNPEIAKLKEQVAELEKDLSASRDAFMKGTQNNQQLIYNEEQAMLPFKKVVSDREYYERQQSILVGKREEKGIHARALADVEQKRELLNLFIYTKLKMLDENVSRVFGKIKFQLIRENINGGFDAICKPYIYDPVKEESSTVTWKSGSKSERVITGVCIAEKIKEHLGLPNLPYLFDEGGEISTDTFKDRFKTESQLICVKIADNINSPLVQPLHS